MLFRGLPVRARRNLRRERDVKEKTEYKQLINI